MIPPTRADAAELERLAGADARARASASPTCAPSRPPTGSASCASPSSPSATAPSCLRERDGGDPRLLRAPHPRRPGGAARRHLRAPRTCSRTTGRTAERDVRPAGRRRRSTARRLRLDFAGTDPQVDGNLNCPLSVTKSAAFFAVRVLTDPDAPPCAGAHRPIEVHRPAPAACSTPSPRPPSPPATSRPRAGSPTSSSPRSPAPARSPPRARGR